MLEYKKLSSATQANEPISPETLLSPIVKTPASLPREVSTGSTLTAPPVMAALIPETTRRVFTPETLRSAARQSQGCLVMPVRLRRAIKKYLRGLSHSPLLLTSLLMSSRGPVMFALVCCIEVLLFILGGYSPHSDLWNLQSKCLMFLF